MLQRPELELEPRLLQLRRRQQRYRLRQEVAGAAGMFRPNLKKNKLRPELKETDRSIGRAGFESETNGAFVAFARCVRGAR